MTYLKGKRLLVTGGAGFLGSEVCRSLEQFEPGEIIVPRSGQHDLREPAVVRKLLADKRPDAIVHLAAVVGGIGANQENPGRFFYDNAVMAIHLMEEARRAGTEKFVSIGSICAYPKHTPVPFSEDELWNGYPEETNAPYGLAKKMLLVQGQAYRQQYDFNAITLFPVNLYGPGDNFDPSSSHVIPALIRKAIEARNAGHDHIDVWGTGTASREFLFVRDAAEAIAAATERYNEADPVNIGSGTEITIRELAEMICDLCDFRGQICWDHSKPDGQPRRCLDTTRAREKFGFTASTSFRDGLIETVAWYEKHRKTGGRAPESRVGGQGAEVRGQRSEVREQESGVRSHQGVAVTDQANSFNSDPAGSASDGHNGKSPIQKPKSEIRNQDPSTHRRTHSPTNLPRRALITGVTGQDGSYLAEFLLEKGYEVHGLVRRSSTFATERINHIYKDPHDPEARLFLHYGDLTDGQNITNLVLDIEPDEIYNLGAQSHVRVSFDQTVYTVLTVAVGALNVLEAARQLNKRREVRVYQASSSEMYGDVLETPQTELTPFCPQSPYACAKVYAFHQTVNYRHAYDLFACNGILFNHESPRRGETFVTRKITRAAARIKQGLQDKLYLGNLDAKRDWGYAKDYVEAMWLMMQHGQPDDFVIATGETHTIREFLGLAFGHLDLDWHNHVEIDPRYYRPTEVNLLLGDASKARNVLGWNVETDLGQLARIMVDADMKLAAAESGSVAVVSR